MKSRIKEGRFKAKEAGIFYAEFMRDMLTTSAVELQDDLINGRRLRGNVIDILLENDQTQEVVLFSVTITETPSNLSF